MIIDGFIIVCVLNAHTISAVSTNHAALCLKPNWYLRPYVPLHQTLYNSSERMFVTPIQDARNHCHCPLTRNSVFLKEILKSWIHLFVFDDSCVHTVTMSVSACNRVRARLSQRWVSQNISQNIRMSDWPCGVYSYKGQVTLNHICTLKPATTKHVN